jgi:CheY-like chemotaxis protein
MNLISNAVRFTRKGGTVTVVAKEVTEIRQTVPATGTEVWLEFLVTDTGCGIPEQKLSSLFNSRISDSDFLFANSEDSGLGLVIVNRLVRLMRGTVGVQSTEGRGTEFTVCIPFTVPDEKTVSAFREAEQLDVTGKTPEKFDFSGRKILLVEEDLLSAQVTVQLLEFAGAKITCIGSPEQGLQIFRNSAINEYDAVLYSLTVASSAEYSFVRKLRLLQREDSKRIPVLALTEHEAIGELNSILDAGMNGCIAKPVKPATLYTALKGSFT